VAWPGDDVVVVGVTASRDVNALLSWVDELASALVPSPLLVLSVEGSDNQVDVAGSLVLVAPSESDGVVPSAGLSDGLGSAIEDEVLVVAGWVELSHPDDPLVASDVVDDLHGSLGSHSGSDVELDVVPQWVAGSERSLDEDGPSLVPSVVAAPGEDVVVVGVSASGDVHALADSVLEVPSVSSDVSPSLVLVVEWSGHKVLSDSESLSESGSDGPVSSVVLSDGLGSGVEGPLLVPLAWVVVPHPDDVLVGSDVLSDLDGSAGSHACSEEEGNSVPLWEVGFHDQFLLEGPLLVGSVVAWPGDEVVVVGVTASRDVNASLSWTDDPLSVCFPSPRLVLVVEGSENHVDVSGGLVLVAPSECNGVASSDGVSDGLGSSVEEELLLGIGWVEVSHPDDVLVASDVVDDLHGSSGSHMGSDVESLSIPQWVVGIEDRSLVDSPPLVHAIVAVPGAEVVVVGVSASNDVDALASLVPEVGSVAGQVAPSLELGWVPPLA